MMIRIAALPACLVLLLLTAGCQTDYDVAEVAPSEHLESGDDHHHENGDECTDEHADNEHHHEDGEPCEDCAESNVHDEQHDDFTGGPSGHSHAAGDRNHGTQWFFNQPWAARFIWGKLLRDGLIFLFLSAVLFLVTRRRKR